MVSATDVGARSSRAGPLHHTYYASKAAWGTNRAKRCAAERGADGAARHPYLRQIKTSNYVREPPELCAMKRPEGRAPMVKWRKRRTFAKDSGRRRIYFW
jgi:hypothetical protein